ncbi:MAG: ATP-dependent DNA ligase [Patescibacteria group bacterium]|nr:ATP-dependent DNA ligase [Patescibacteria group bacterium]
MKFADLSLFLQKLESTKSRNETTIILADLFSQLEADEIGQAIYLILGELAASYKGVVFNVADKTMLAAIAKTYQKQINDVFNEYKKTGDIGETAYTYAAKANSKDIGLSVTDVYLRLFDIANDSGQGSIERKIDKLSMVLSDMDPLSVKYLARIPVGKLRLGFSEKTIIDALSWMAEGSKEKSKLITKAYEVVPDVGALAEKIRRFGIKKATGNLSPIVGIPVMPMLCQRLKSPDEMIEKMGEVSVEPKFDGLRSIIHYSKPKKVLAVFTRNLKDISFMFPELFEIDKYLSVDEVILDTEAVGMDEDMLKIADFQTTMQRRRKHDIANVKSKTPISFQVFDVLYADGRNLMQEPYSVRREVLKKIIKNGKILRIDENVITKDPAVILKLHKKYIKEGLEGIIVKKLNSKYIPGRTGWNWVKMKEDESAIGKLPDTIDAVIMGFTAGFGKRVEFGIGQFLAGVLDRGKYKTITKVGTGLTDEQFKQLAMRLKPLVVKDKPEVYEVHKDLTPDYWVDPQIVVELAGDDLTISPKHTAGYALRFPRLVRFRDDKSPQEATTLSEVRELFEIQK